MSIDSNIRFLVEISKQKYAMLEELHSITKSQNISIKNQTIDILMKEISSKQEIMNSIDKLDIEFYSKYKSLKKELKISSLEEVKVSEYPKLQELKDITASIMSMLKDIDQQDKKNKGILNKDIDKIKSEFKQVKNNISNSKKIYSGYNKYSHSQGVFIDNKK